MPCPVCIGYGVASGAKYIQDDEEELDALWKEIDEMLAQDKKESNTENKNEDGNKKKDGAA
jgi:hypothetical protein